MADEHVERMLKVEEVFKPSKEIIENAWVKDYEKTYKHALLDPEGFWGDIAKELESASLVASAPAEETHKAEKKEEKPKEEKHEAAAEGLSALFG